DSLALWFRASLLHSSNPKEQLVYVQRPSVAHHSTANDRFQSQAVMPHVQDIPPGADLAILGGAWR
ncbi:hypothetical protein, partial [Acidithiobacillus caldus]|uniref:hypothetical protein n=1 Tax=Acidithiobacillus caldus TaxID=33059 RepID=UPI001C077C82